MGTDNPTQAAEAFEVWRRERGIEPHDFDVLRLSRPKARADVADGRSTEFDLGDFRQISSLAVCPSPAGPPRPMTVWTSVDGASWERLAGFEGASGATSRVQPPRLAKYVHIEGDDGGEAPPHRVQLFSEVIGDPLPR